jgi:hypothetical protein
MEFRRPLATQADAGLAVPADRVGREDRVVGVAIAGPVDVAGAAGVVPAAPVVVRRAAAETAEP